MKISEENINFSSLSPNDFEKLCFDLILNFQYENGSADYWVDL